MIRSMWIQLVCSAFLATLCLSQGSVLLVGGGTENYSDWSDAPYRWMVTHAANRKIAILHYGTTTTFFSGYLPWLEPCTVSNLAISSVSQANDSATYRFILEHDGIFLRGGDQAQYVGLWKGTLTQQAIREVFQRGGVIGGTSAGEMVLSNVTFSSGTANPWSLLRTPTSSLTLVDDFLPLVPNILAESHTNERGRIGRLPVFLARYKDVNGREIGGVAVDANTALAVDQDGVGEVMGGSAVTLLRWNADTRYTIESGRSFSLSGMQFDQLLPGWKVNLQTGAITMPSTAVAFAPRSISAPKGAVILDGSGDQTDWPAVGGSLKKLQSILNSPVDTVGIFSSPATPASAQSVNTSLSSLGVASRILWIDELRKDDSSTAIVTTSCGAFVLVGNALDSLGRILSSTTRVGGAFASRVDAGVPLLFLSEDVMLAGEMAIGGIYSSQYNAYYGNLVRHSGLNVVKGIQFAPRFYQNTNNTAGYTYTENRVMGMLWSMGRSKLPYGMMIDAGAHVLISGDSVGVFGLSSSSTPVLLIDARCAQWTDFPTFQDPGKSNAVQNAALVGATLRAIRSGDSYDLTAAIDDQSSLPLELLLDQNYPNPFNPSTMIRYFMPHTARVSLKIFDVLGREIAVLVDQEVQRGVHIVQWDATRNPSGVYFARLDQREETVRSQSIKLVFIK